MVDEPHDLEELQVDDDVQFTVYRPSAVTPDVWHPFVAFAYRTEPIVLPDGRTVRPLEQVEQRAAQLLSDLPSAYESVRTDSDAGLPRGTDLLFEPWIESGAFNPPTQSLRWEEAVHEVHFRLRVPASADGSRLRGGIRVFAGAVVIGDLTFRLPVSSEQTAVAAATDRDTTRRFRRIFASYSHRDVAVVEAVEQYVSATGDRYLIDSESLRSGEVWDERLCRLIDEADIFQLFWSTNAMNSPFVRREWELLAGQLGRRGLRAPRVLARAPGRGSAQGSAAEGTPPPALLAIAGGPFTAVGHRLQAVRSPQRSGRRLLRKLPDSFSNGRARRSGGLLLTGEVAQAAGRERERLCSRPPNRMVPRELHRRRHRQRPPARKHHQDRHRRRHRLALKITPSHR